jgi:hypothetical protein
MWSRRMSRPLCAAKGGLVCHALNRANPLLLIFDDDDDAAFERALAESVTRYDMRLLPHCVMSNFPSVLERPANPAAM